MGGLNQDVLAHHHQSDQGGWGGIQVASEVTHMSILTIIITTIIMIDTRHRVDLWAFIQFGWVYLWVFSTSQFMPLALRK